MAKKKENKHNKIKSYYAKQKETYHKKFNSISDADLRKIVSMLALKDVTSDIILKLLLKKKIITKDELYAEIIKEFKIK